jgi:uncharacterized protein (TIGR02996 family)
MPAKPKSPFPDPAATLAGEADILANVLADLSDHNAKLVYADWLEEHNDKRGPLLREFITAYRAGKKLPAVKSAPQPWRDLVGITLMLKVRGTALAPRVNELLALARPAISYKATFAAENTLPVGTSRFGGRPDLPTGNVWPTDNGVPLVFLMQFNLADLRVSPVARELPAAGLLSLFCRLGENFDSTSWQLFYIPDMSSAVRHEDQPIEEFAKTGRYSFVEALTLPRPDSPWQKEVNRAVGSAADEYDELCYSMRDFRLLGYPHTLEGDVLGAKSVRHLITIGGRDTPNWWPSDSLMYLTIPGADLKHTRFDRARATVQIAG